MKGKYITTQIKLVCSSKAIECKKDIHAQLAETIAARKLLLQKVEGIQQKARIIAFLFPQAA